MALAACQLASALHLATADRAARRANAPVTFGSADVVTFDIDAHPLFKLEDGEVVEQVRTMDGQYWPTAYRRHEYCPHYGGHSEWRKESIIHQDSSLYCAISRAHDMAKAVGHSVGPLKSMLDKADQWLQQWWRPRASTDNATADSSMKPEDEEAVCCPCNGDAPIGSWLVDSGSCFHLLGQSDVPTGQRLAKLKEPIRITTANGEVVHTKRTSTPVRVLGKELNTVVVGECPPVTSLGRFCIDNKMDFVWLGSTGQKPVLVRGAVRRRSTQPTPPSTNCG